MIIDTMDRITLYQSVLPHAQEIAAMWNAGSAAGASFEVRDKRYDTRPDEKRRFEVHHHTIDLMIGLEGREIIHICPMESLIPAEPLANGGDGMKMDGALQGHAVMLAPGTFAAIYPGEAHMVGGCVTHGQTELLHKWVIKLDIDA